MKRPQYLINFDSTTAMLRANSRYLQGRGLPMLGMQPEPVVRALRPVGRALERLPRKLAEELFSLSGAMETIRPERLGTVDARKVARWMVSVYPQRPYPAVAIGSSSGAMTHLWCALGIPWLPQTFLVGVRRKLDPDEPRLDMQWGRRVAPGFLANNPELSLHHMHDPNQDRLMAARMAYFRCKRLTLGEEYERFIEANLEPGGTIFVSDCRQRWPVSVISDRHAFQVGAVGGARPDEFLHGGPRVSRYLRRYRSWRVAWDAPEAHAEAPEAEWGFDERLMEDIRRFARHNGFRVRRVGFDNPETPSPWVAEMYRWWYRRRGMFARRLLVSSFAMLDPYGCLRTGSVPFWMTFNKEPSAELLEKYLETKGPFEEVYLLLFAHGVDSVGLVPIERWVGILGRARRGGKLLGIDPAGYPRHLAAMPAYHHAIMEGIAARYHLPGPLRLEDFDGFLREHPSEPWVEVRDEYVPSSLMQREAAE